MMMIILKELKNYGHNIVMAVGSESGDNKEIIDQAKYVLGSDRARGSVIQSLKVIFIERPDIVFLNLGYINLALFIKCIYPNINIIVRIGNTVSSELSDNAVLRNIRIILLWLSVVSSDTIIVQSELMKKDLLRYIRKKTRIKVLPNIVEQDFFEKASEENVINVNKYIFCAATNKKQKRLDLLLYASIELMRNNRDLHLVVAGTLYKEIEPLLFIDVYDPSILCRIHFLGFIKNILPMIRDCLFCVSSSDYEGSSNYLIESRALNKYCVVTDCPGANRETFNGYNKVLYVNCGSVDELYKGMNIALNITSPIINVNKEKTHNELCKYNIEKLHWAEALIKIFE